jgi:hypothetical protein
MVFVEALRVIGRQLVSHFPYSEGYRRDSPVFYDQIAALPDFLLHLELHLLLFFRDQTVKNYKVASVHDIRLPKKM